MKKAGVGGMGEKGAPEWVEGSFLEVIFLICVYSQDQSYAHLRQCQMRMN